MVMVMVPEALRQVGWLCQRHRQSFHRLRAFYWPKLPQTQSFPSAQSFPWKTLLLPKCNSLKQALSRLSARLSRRLSSRLSSARGSQAYSVITSIVCTVPVYQRSPLAVKAGIGPSPSTGRPPAIYRSIGPRAHVYGSTIDGYRLRVAQGSTGSLL